MITFQPQMIHDNATGELVPTDQVKVYRGESYVGLCSIVKNGPLWLKQQYPPSVTAEICAACEKEFGPRGSVKFPRPVPKDILERYYAFDSGGDSPSDTGEGEGAG